MKENIIIYFCLCFFIILMALIVPFSQFKSDVNNGAFKLIKIKKFTFMFRAPNGRSVFKEGLALPLFIMHIIGYMMSFLCLVTNILLLLVFNQPLIILGLVTISLFVAEVIFVIIFSSILSRMSHVKPYSKK